MPLGGKNRAAEHWHVTCRADQLSSGVGAVVALGTDAGGGGGVVQADVAAQGLAHVVDAHVDGEGGGGQQLLRRLLHQLREGAGDGCHRPGWAEVARRAGIDPVRGWTEASWPASFQGAHGS